MLFASLALPLVLIIHDPSGDGGGCVCDANRAGGGWCEHCGVGYYAGLEFNSKKLAQTLDTHGHTVVAEKTKCKACRELIATGGFCESCRMGFIGKKGYFSRVCFQIAKGEPVDRKALPTCCTSGGWCDKCNRGIVGNRSYGNKRDFEAARRAVAILQAAIAKSEDCETCAASMIGDARCHLCRISYHDGKPVMEENSTDGEMVNPKPQSQKPPGLPTKAD